MELFNELEQTIFNYVLNAKEPVTGVQIAAHAQVSTQKALGIAVGFTGLGIFDQIKTDQKATKRNWLFQEKEYPVMAYTITDYGKGMKNKLKNTQRRNNFGGLIANPV